MRILVTGAAGHVASLGIPGILPGNRLLLTDLRPPAEIPPGVTCREADLLAASDAELAQLFEGIEVVVHSAYVPSGQPDVYSLLPPQIERFGPEFENVRMAQRVYRSALEAGVRRVVAVSSNHAADWYEHQQIHARRRDTVSPDDYPLADNFYGWAKAASELLGWPYACGTFGRRLEVVNLRIGSPYEIDVGRYEADAAPAESSLPRPAGIAGFKRALGAWLSPRDCAGLFRAAVHAPRIAGPGEPPWVVAYGISDNTRAFWSLETARRLLGYRPQDDSEIVYADAVRRLLHEGACAGRLGVPAPGA
jgi:NAD+ dependent glucose-6-phosphate dehydrogenase